MPDPMAVAVRRLAVEVLGLAEATEQIAAIDKVASVRERAGQIQRRLRGLIDSLTDV